MISKLEIKRMSTLSRVSAPKWLGALAISLFVFFPVAHADDWTRFVGKYSGTATASTESGDQQRTLQVEISEIDDGFRVIWDTSRVKETGKIKRDEYKIDFAKSDREGIYASRMKPGLFGDRKPLDPLKGEPYVWARIDDTLMTVYAMLINDSGDYEMQVYERQLVEDGMVLNFTRYRRSKVLSHIEARLIRE